MRSRARVRSVVAALVLVAAIGVLEASAHAAPAPIAELTAATPLSGGEGWLVWSSPVAGGWALMGYHGGSVTRLPAAPGQQAFDASVGTDASGAPVVVFSRCVKAPTMSSAGGEAPGGALGGELFDSLTAVGCRIHLLPLNGGPERALPVPAPAKVSDTTPSIWRGVVTFARHAPAHGKVMQVLSWSARAPRRLRTLPHGVVPPCPHSEQRCTELPLEAEVSGLASDGSIVAFDWRVYGGGAGLDGAQELRVDRVNGRRPTIADGELGNEACTRASAGEHVLERVTFEPPFVSGATASFGELYDFGCFTGFAGVLAAHGATPGPTSRGKLEGVTLNVASDEGQLYGLVAAPSEALAPLPAESWTATDGPYCSPSFPCAIEPLSTPTSKRDRRPPFEPLGFHSGSGRARFRRAPSTAAAPPTSRRAP